jgi:hypothetical protein
MAGILNYKLYLSTKYIIQLCLSNRFFEKLEFLAAGQDFDKIITKNKDNIARTLEVIFRQ